MSRWWLGSLVLLVGCSTGAARGVHPPLLCLPVMVQSDDQVGQAILCQPIDPAKIHL